MLAHNIPIDKMSARGIPVFNTPGANANSVKELVLCSLFASARNITGAINHIQDISYKPDKWWNSKSVVCVREKFAKEGMVVKTGVTMEGLKQINEQTIRVNYLHGGKKENQDCLFYVILILKQDMVKHMV
mgnify:CR=1 FL=1